MGFLKHLILKVQSMSSRYVQIVLAIFPNSSPKCDTLQFKRLASFLQKPWLAA